jgi:hypothetical protein
MADYITNTQISVPLNTGLKADVNLNGLMFSYEHGMFYQVTTQQIPITLPPPFRTDNT